MGISTSRISKTNQDLNDLLAKESHITTPSVERVLRSVDRALFLDNVTEKLTPYHGPWKVGNIHLSAPCIYARVLEALDLQPGLSFLNLGSGTGYLSTLAGLMIGPHGLNHGIEIHNNVVEYANKKLALFKQQSYAVDGHDFLEPEFIQGDCLKLNPSTRRYDRVYLGAVCQPEQEDYMKDLIKIGGILVMPINEQLVRYERISEFDWDSHSLLSVIFNTLIDREGNEHFDLPAIQPKGLNEICRDKIRHCIREQIEIRNPGIKFSDNLKQRNQHIIENRARKREKSKSRVHEDLTAQSKSESPANANIQKVSSDAGSSLEGVVASREKILSSLSPSSSSSSSTTTGEGTVGQISLPFMMLERFVQNGLDSETTSSDDEDLNSTDDEETSESDNIDDCSEYDSDSDRAHEDIINMITLRDAASVFRIGFESDENRSDSQDGNDDELDDDHNSTSSVSMSSGYDDKRCASEKSSDETQNNAQKSLSNDPNTSDNNNIDKNISEQHARTNDTVEIKHKEKRVDKEEERTSSRLKRRKNSDTSHDEDKMFDNSTACVNACSIITDASTLPEPSCSHAKDDSAKSKSTDESIDTHLDHPPKGCNGEKKKEGHPNSRVKHITSSKRVDASNDCNNSRPKSVKRESAKANHVRARRKSVSKSKHELRKSKTESQSNECDLKEKRPRISESRQYFEHMRKIIMELPLPYTLQLYLNYDRKLID